MRLRALATGLVVSSAALGLLAGGGVLAAKHHASKRPASSQSKFLKWVAAKKTVDLTLIASYPGPGGPFSFDGYGGGKMTITVPLGARVDVTFSNHGDVPHSAMILPWAKHANPGQNPSPVFKGASSPTPISGTAQGATVHFSFVAAKAGKYAIVCAFPGHAELGMWDNFIVKKGLKAPSLTT